MAEKPSEKPILACPICGSLRLGWVGGGVNSVFDSLGVSSLSGMDVCQDCGRKVFPIELENEQKYREFVAYIKERKAGKSAGAAERAAEMAESARDKAVLEDEPDPARGIFRIDILILYIAVICVALVALFLLLSQSVPPVSLLPIFLVLAGLGLIYWAYKKKK